MLSKIFLTVAFSLFIQGRSFAGESASFSERMIGGSFKAMAKAYIAAADLAQLKEKNISRIEEMKEDRFARRFVKVYAFLKELPAPLRKKYRVKENMAKEDAIADIRSLDKAQIYAIIDAVPDRVIAAEFNQQIAAQGGQARGDLMAGISKMWGRVAGAVNAPAER